MTIKNAFKEVENTNTSSEKDKSSNPRNKRWPYTNSKLQFCYSLFWESNISTLRAVSQLLKTLLWYQLTHADYLKLPCSTYKLRTGICTGDVDRQCLSVWCSMNEFCPYRTPILILDWIGPISTLKWKVCKNTQTQIKNTKGTFCHQYKWKPGGIQICVLSILSDSEPINQEHLQGINSHHHRIQ